jgi:hypothetical protein
MKIPMICVYSLWVCFPQVEGVLLYSIRTFGMHFASALSLGILNVLSQISLHHWGRPGLCGMFRCIVGVCSLDSGSALLSIETDNNVPRHCPVSTG